MKRQFEELCSFKKITSSLALFCKAFYKERGVIFLETDVDNLTFYNISHANIYSLKILIKLDSKYLNTHSL